MLGRLGTTLLIALVIPLAGGCRRDAAEATAEAVAPPPLADEVQRVAVRPSRPAESQALSPSTADPSARGVGWQPDLSAALAAARAEARPVMAVFYHRGFGGSLELRRDGFSDPEVGRLARFFVCVQVEYETSVEQATDLGVVAIPCVVFLRPDGEPYLTIEGYGSAERVARAMRRAIGG